MYKKDDRSSHQNSIKFYIFIASKGVGLYLGHIFFYCTELFLFFYGQHLLLYRCSSWTVNTRGVYNFITKKAKNSSKFGSVLQWCLVPMLLLLKVWSNLRPKTSFFLKEQKSQGYLFKTGPNFAVVKTLVWSAYVWRSATAKFFYKKE